MKGFTPIILIVVSIAIFFFFIDPQYKAVQDLKAEVAENEKTLDLAKELREKREELRDRFNQISEEEKRELEKLLPDTVDNVRLIIDINNIAEEYGIVIRNIQIDSGNEDVVENTRVVENEFDGINRGSGLSYVDTSQVGVIGFSFTVTAEYDIFIEFLKDLEEALRIVDVRTVDISKTGEGEIFYNYQVKLDTYWLK